MFFSRILSSVFILLTLVDQSEFYETLTKNVSYGNLSVSLKFDKYEDIYWLDNDNEKVRTRYKKLPKYCYSCLAIENQGNIEFTP